MPYRAQENQDAGAQWQVAVVMLAGADVALGHVVNPLFAHQLLAVPLALLEHELAQFGLAFGLQAQSPAAHLDAVGGQFPVGLGDVQGGEYAFLHILQQWFARQPGDDCGKHMGAHGVIVKFLANGMEFAGKPAAQPVLVAVIDALILGSACRHHEHIAHSEAVEGGRQDGGHLVPQVL